MERLEAFRDAPRKEKQIEAPAVKHYEPKLKREEFDICDSLKAEIIYEFKELYIEDSCGCVTIPFEEIPTLTQFFAWLMRERDLSTEDVADAE